MIITAAMVKNLRDKTGAPIMDCKKALEESAGDLEKAISNLRKKGVTNTVNFIEGNVYDENLMNSLGKFNFVYSTYSLHHWKDPVNAFRIIYNSVVAEDGLMVIHDLRRTGLLYHLPLNNGVIESVKAAYIPDEISTMLNNIGISNYTINTPFPFMTIFMHK